MGPGGSPLARHRTQPPRPSTATPGLILAALKRSGGARTTSRVAGLRSRVPTVRSSEGLARHCRLVPTLLSASSASPALVDHHCTHNGQRGSYDMEPSRYFVCRRLISSTAGTDLPDLVRLVVCQIVKQLRRPIIGHCAGSLTPTRQGSWNRTGPGWPRFVVLSRH